MRFTTSQYLEKEVVTVSARNNNASLAILDGQPIALQGLAEATNFGTDVSLPNDTNFKASLILGIAKWFKLAGNSTQLTGAQVGDVFEAVVYGFTDAIITLRTRSATTISWTSVGAIAEGDLLVPETAANNLSWSTTTASLGEGFFAGQSQASQTTLVSTGSLLSAASNATADTIRMKVLVRLM